MEETATPRSKRLTLDVDIEIHQAIKARAAIRNISLRIWVLRAIEAAIKAEKQYE